MSEINLDEVGEEIVETRTVRADGRVYTFPGTLSVNACRQFVPKLDQLQAAAAGGDIGALLGAMEDILKPLAGDDQTRDILDHVNVKKVELMVTGLFQAYGLGEAAASSSSSASTGQPSRPTSNGSTESISDTPSSDQSTDTLAASPV